MQLLAYLEGNPSIRAFEQIFAPRILDRPSYDMQIPQTIKSGSVTRVAFLRVASRALVVNGFAKLSRH